MDKIAFFFIYELTSRFGIKDSTQKKMRLGIFLTKNKLLYNRIEFTLKEIYPFARF